MEKNKECPKCGCREIGKGNQIAGGKMFPIDNPTMSFGSDVIADICTECGYIIDTWVKKPEKFKPKK